MNKTILGGDWGEPKVDKIWSKPSYCLLGPAVAKITWRFWYWTNSEEDLFTLSKDSLAWFKLFVREANK